MIFSKKNILPFIFPVVALLLMPGCIHNDFEEPPLSDIPVGTVLTIAQLRDMYNDEPILFADDYSVYATVTMDDKSGNIYRNAYVQDATGAINLRLQAPGGIYQGDHVRIALKGTTLSSYQQMLQVDNVNVDKNIIKKITNHSVEPKTISLDQISQAYQGELVKIEGVQFVADVVGQPFADSENLLAKSSELEDCFGNVIIVRTSGYANFADDLIPELNGSLIAVISQYRSVFQLLIRNINELEMNDPRCEEEDDDDAVDPSGSGTFDDPYNVAHAVAFNTGTGKWVEGYITGVMETNVDPFTPSFEPPFHTNSNLIIADFPTETSLSKSIIVQLPFGELRNKLNLVDNPSNKGQKVKLQGDLEAYFGQPGLRNTSDYWMEDDDDDDNGDDGAVTFIDEDFQSYPDHSVIDQYGWTAYAEEGGRNWICRTHEGNHYAQATAFNSPDATNVMWMITPPIDRDAMSKPIFEFESAKAFYTHDGFSLWISTDFDGTNVTSATWEPLDARLAGEGDPDHDWIHSGHIDLSSYQGVLYIAWKYEAAAPEGKTGTFRVDNVKLSDE